MKFEECIHYHRETTSCLDIPSPSSRPGNFSLWTTIYSRLIAFLDEVAWWNSTLKVKILTKLSWFKYPRWSYVYNIVWKYLLRFDQLFFYRIAPYMFQHIWNFREKKREILENEYKTTYLVVVKRKKAENENILKPGNEMKQNWSHQ